MRWRKPSQTFNRTQVNHDAPPTSEHDPLVVCHLGAERYGHSGLGWGAAARRSALGVTLAMAQFREANERFFGLGLRIAL